MKCHMCRKKALIGITCTCKNYYCLKHRHPEKHQCTQLQTIITTHKDKLKEDIMGGVITTPKVIPI